MRSTLTPDRRPDVPCRIASPLERSAILSVDLFGALAKLIGCKTIFRINIKMFHWKTYLGMCVCRPFVRVCV